MCRFPARKRRQQHIHSVHAGHHGQGPKDDGDTSETLGHERQLVRYRGEMGVQDPGDPILEENRFVGETLLRTVVDVAKAIGVLCPIRSNSRRARPAMTSRCGMTTRRASRRCRVSPRGFRWSAPCGRPRLPVTRCRRATIRARRPLGDLLHYSIDNAMHEGDGSLSQREVGVLADLVTSRAAPPAVVHRDKKAAPRKKSMSSVSNACSSCLKSIS